MSGYFFTFNEIAQAVPGKWVNKPEQGGIKSVFTDSRTESYCGMFIAITGEKFDAHCYLQTAIEQGAILLCIESAKENMLPPEIPALLVESTVTAYQQLANFHKKRFPDLKVVALTGSSGKTGTKETLRAIFNHVYGAEHVLATEGNTNNQIGVPQNLLKLNKKHKIAVIEMGTNHHGEIESLSRSAEPDAAMIVNIGNCHIEFLGSLEGVAREKSKIFSHMKSDGTAVIPANSPGNTILKKATCQLKCVTFGFENADFTVNYLGGDMDGSSFEITDMQKGETERVEWALSGRHHAQNAAGASAIAASLGISLKDIAIGIAGTTLPGMRMRRVNHHGATWINDAYNANPDSMQASLEWLAEFAEAGNLLLVLGDMAEIGMNSASAHKKVLETARCRFPLTKIIAVGKQMSSALQRMDKQLAAGIYAFNDSQTAGEHILDFVKNGDTVFLKASRSTKLELVEPPYESK